MQVGDHLLADRGYFDTGGSRARRHRGRVVHRAREYGVLRFHTAPGEAFDSLAKVCRVPRPGQTRPQEVQLLDLEGRRRPGRVWVLRKTGEAVRVAHQGLLQEASRKGRKVRPQTWKFAQYVIVFTTLPAADFPAARVLEWCRLRWQFGLVYKRFKSLARLGHLPKLDDDSARVWIWALVVARSASRARRQQATAIKLVSETRQD